MGFKESTDVLLDVKLGEEAMKQLESTLTLCLTGT